MALTADERRRLQAEEAQDYEGPVPPTRHRTVPPDEQCLAKLGRRCDFSMRGPDGVYRCWLCCRKQPCDHKFVDSTICLKCGWSPA